MIDTPWMNRKEAAAYLGVSVRHINRLARQGKLARHRPDGTGYPRYRKADLDALMKPETATT